MEKNQQFKQDIIETAQKVFSRFGLKKTTMDDVARLLNKGKSTLYYYFENKEELFIAVIAKEVEVVRKYMQAEINKGASAQEKLRYYALGRMQCISKLLNFYGALKDDYLKHYAFIQKMRKQYDEEEIATLRAILKEGADKGEFVIEDLDLTASAITYAIKGLEYPWAIEADSGKLEKNIDTMLGILFNGLLKK